MPEKTNSKPKLRWYQFSLRALLLLVTAFAIFMSWFTVKMQQAKKQKEIVAEIENYAHVCYDYQMDSMGNFDVDGEPFAPKWLINWLGIDFFATAVSVERTNLPCENENFKQIAELPYLKRIELDSSCLDDDDINAFTKLKALRFLNIFSEKITHVGIDHLKKLPNLKTLIFRLDNILDSELEPLNKLIKLEELELHGDRLTDAAFEHIKELTKLRVLTFSIPHFTGRGLSYLKGLDQLEELMISSDKMIDVELDHLADFPKLESLEISNSQLTDDSLSHFKRLTHLKKLKLYSQKISEEGISKLKNDLPNTAINDSEGMGMGGKEGGTGMGF